uniref:FERM domain-containing protein 6-like n=1 Tax=Myxine glutinosa TaxID=7769 RepID=UPI00358FF8F2
MSWKGLVGGKPSPRDTYKLCVVLPSDELLTLITNVKATVQEAFLDVCNALNMKDSQLFGLSVLKDNEHIFMDMNERLIRYCPKEWRKENSKGTEFRLPLTIFFKVQFYVENGHLINDKQARQHYYWQLRKQVLASCCPFKEETYFLLAAFALQADLGNFQKARHTTAYFDPRAYFPTWVLTRRSAEYVLRHLPPMHREHSGMKPSEARLHYIRSSWQLDDVPVHFYRLFQDKKEADASLKLGVTLNGIQIFQRCTQGHRLLYNFPWCNVGRFTFSGKQFVLEPDGLPSARKLSYYTGCTIRAQHLLRLLSSTHRLYLRLQPRLAKLRRLEEKEEKSRYRESYISDTLDLDLDRLEEQRSLPGNTGGPARTRRSTPGHERWSGHSAVSRASTHTSGIEADARTRPELEVSMNDCESETCPCFFAADGNTYSQIPPSPTEEKNMRVLGPSMDNLPQALLRRTCKVRDSIDRHSQSLDDIRFQHGDRTSPGLLALLGPDVSQSLTFGWPHQVMEMVNCGHAAAKGAATLESSLVRRASNCLSLNLIGAEALLEFVL